VSQEEFIQPQVEASAPTASADRAARVRRRRIQVAAIASIVVIAGVAVYLVARTSASSTGSPDSALPKSAGGLVLETDAASQAEAASVVKNAQALSSLTGEVAGAYGPADDGRYTMVFLKIPYSAMSSALQSQAQAMTPSALVSQISTGSGLEYPLTRPSAEPSAALTCGMMQINSQIIPTCFWADDREIAIGYFYAKYQFTSATDTPKEMDALAIAASKS
jgi:hypothetical protein